MDYLGSTTVSARKKFARYEANVEAGSNHPLAKSDSGRSQKRAVSAFQAGGKGFESFAGSGVKAQVNGKVVLAGKEKVLKDSGSGYLEGNGQYKKFS